MKESGSYSSLIETEDSFFEYDMDCLRCNISTNTLIILMCLKYVYDN